MKFRGIAAVALGASLLSVAGAKAGADTTSMPVIVRAAGSLSAAEATVAAAGGTVGRELRIINGFSAHLPKDAVAKVAAQDAVAAVTRDRSVTFAGTTPPYSAGKDTGSLFNIVRSMSVNQLWNQHYSGQGIGVALIDSGVTPVPGLTAGNVIDGPDLSLDAGTPSLRSLDDFGHGTHLAGIIAGRDSTAQNYTAYNDPSKFTGVAPDATLVNVKVGAANGAVDVSQVIAALDWVVAHKDDPGINIRVVNLSFGTDSTQAYQVDPLVYAAEAAWRAGLVVVVAAGNEGNTVSTLTDPATDPYVIAVGADGHYDKDGHKQYISSFSNAGSPGRHPDVVAPGQSTTSLRDPGSFADTLYPGGRVGDPAGRFFRGSGTSQSAAVVTGVVADLLSKYPTMTPDQVKGTLMQYALPLAGVDPALQGAGEVNASKFPGLKTNGMPSYAQSWEPSDGSGSIEASRGSSHLTSSNGDVLSGETTVFGAAFDGHSWTDNAWDAASWEGGSWTGHSWTGHSWTGDTWTGHSWTTDQWAGHSWTDDSWDGHSWTGDSWTGHSWTDDTWTGHSWTGTTWG